jgi:ferric-dicitrate binding protein FerR (iron transport regulator)
MSDDYLWDRSGPPDPEIEKLEQLLAPLAHDKPLRRARRRWPLFAAGGAVLAAAAVAIVLVLPKRNSETGFDFIAREGTVLVNQRAVSTGTLATGDVLDTRGSHVELQIADIGRAELAPDTQIRLERSDPSGRHLAIDRGRLHARVSAPPRLFVVSTPATRVTDLGCEYTIEVDATGTGSIHVESGQVELGTKSGAVAVAPAGTHAHIAPGDQPGLPVVDGASRELDLAAERFAATDVLALATARDAITVIDLAFIDPAHRADALARLAELAPPPAGVTPAGAAGDARQRARWRDDVLARYFASGKIPSKKKNP